MSFLNYSFISHIKHSFTTIDMWMIEKPISHINVHSFYSFYGKVVSNILPINHIVEIHKKWFIYVYFMKQEAFLISFMMCWMKIEYLMGNNLQNSEFNSQGLFVHDKIFYCESIRNCFLIFWFFKKKTLFYIENRMHWS